MKQIGNHLAALALFLGAAGMARAQEVVPDGPFKTVHLVIATPVQEALLVSAAKIFNQEFAQQGCATCMYKVFKMVSGKESKYNYMITAEWPSSDVYLRIHGSKEFKSNNQKNPIMSDLSPTEFYGRYVEIK